MMTRAPHRQRYLVTLRATFEGVTAIVEAADEAEAEKALGRYQFTDALEMGGAELVDFTIKKIEAET